MNDKPTLSNPCVADFIRAYKPAGVILSGPASVCEDSMPRAPTAVFELGIPVLGICYGMQTMTAQLGGKVEIGKVREFGSVAIGEHHAESIVR